MLRKEKNITVDELETILKGAIIKIKVVKNGLTDRYDFEVEIIYPAVELY